MSFHYFSFGYLKFFLFQLALGCSLLLLGSDTAYAKKAEKNVLVIHSYHPQFSWTKTLKTNIQQEFSKSSQDIQVFNEFLDAKRFPQLDHQIKFFEAIQSKYRDTSLDVVIVSDDPGLEVVLNHRETYFSRLPIVFLGINTIQPKLLTQPNITGVFEIHDQLATVEEALRQTGSQGLIVISDSSQTGRAESSRAREIQGLSNAPEELVILDDLTPQTLKNRLQVYPAHWPILLWGQLRQGHAHGPLIDIEESTRLIRETVPNPLYGASMTHIGNGVVGGKVLDGKHHAQEAVEFAQKILAGQSPDQLSPITESQHRWLFDERELKRFSIAVDQLPVGSKLVNVQFSFYKQHRRLVWGVIAAFSITLLIIVLWMEILRRRAIAARVLQENQRYKDLAQAGADVFWELSPEMKFSYVSGDTRKANGLEPADYLGRSPEEVFRNATHMEVDWHTFTELFNAHQPIRDFLFRVREGESGLRIFKLNGNPIFIDDHFLGYRGIKREITQEYYLAENLAYQATYDSLTGLINRQTFDQHLQNTVNRVQQFHRSSVLCYLDLDQFKIVNDTAGHLVGDRLLAEIAQLLQGSIRTTDILGRLGGDEFGIILEGCPLPQAQNICETLVKKVQNYRFHWGERQFTVGASIGVVAISATNPDAVDLLSRADLACYRAKDLGRGRVYITSTSDQDLASQQVQMSHLASLTQAIEENCFSLMQQPIVPLNSKQVDSTQGFDQDDARIPHFEVLLRLHDQQGNVISPGLFIPEAERYGLIGTIDRWVLKTIVNQAANLCVHPRSLLSINISGASLSDKHFLEEAIALIRESTLLPHHLCFEITETAAISHLEQAKSFIHAFKTLGVKFALDDFGSGVSSFGYLRELPVDFLKIDGSLVRHISTHETDRAIVRLINDIAHMMDMKTIAEFVENDEIRDCLIDIGVDYAQGYLIGRPEPLLHSHPDASAEAVAMSEENASTFFCEQGAS